MAVADPWQSTLIKLIPRFYDTSEGQILVDGVDVNQFTAPADIVGLSAGARFHYLPHSPAVVFDIQPVPHIFAFTVNRQRFVCQGI